MIYTACQTCDDTTANGLAANIYVSCRDHVPWLTFVFADHRLAARARPALWRLAAPTPARPAAAFLLGPLWATTRAASSMVSSSLMPLTGSALPLVTVYCFLHLLMLRCGWCSVAETAILAGCGGGGGSSTGGGDVTCTSTQITTYTSDIKTSCNCDPTTPSSCTAALTNVCATGCYDALAEGMTCNNAPFSNSDWQAAFKSQLMAAMCVPHDVFVQTPRASFLAWRLRPT